MVCKSAKRSDVGQNWESSSHVVTASPVASSQHFVNWLNGTCTVLNSPSPAVKSALKPRAKNFPHCAKAESEPKDTLYPVYSEGVEVDLVVSSKPVHDDTSAKAFWSMVEVLMKPGAWRDGIS